MTLSIDEVEDRADKRADRLAALQAQLRRIKNEFAAAGIDLDDVLAKEKARQERREAIAITVTFNVSCDSLMPNAVAAEELVEQLRKKVYPYGDRPWEIRGVVLQQIEPLIIV